jgi:hypothetical protein
MKARAKSSITLSADEVRLVSVLKARLRVKTNVGVVRRGLRLLECSTDRRALREAYRKASAATRESTARDLRDLDHL